MFSEFNFRDKLTNALLEFHFKIISDFGLLFINRDIDIEKLVDYNQINNDNFL